MTKVYDGTADPCSPTDSKIEWHEVTISGGSTETISWDYVYDSEPRVAISTDKDYNVTVQSKGTSQCTIANKADYERARGVATIPSDSTEVTVPHGLSETPDAEDMLITPVSSLTDATFIFIDQDTIGATNFKIKSDQVPGTEISVTWQASIADASSAEADVEVIAIGS